MRPSTIAVHIIENPISPLPIQARDTFLESLRISEMVYERYRRKNFCKYFDDGNGKYYQVTFYEGEDPLPTEDMLRMIAELYEAVREV